MDKVKDKAKNEGKQKRKTNFISAIICLVIGLVLALLGAYCYFAGNTQYEGFIDWAIQFIIIGIIDLCVCFYWSRPKNRNKFDKRIHDENISVKDERMQAIRGRTASLMYVLTILVLGALMGVALFIEIEMPYVLVLLLFFFFELIGGWAFSRYYQKKM